MKKPEIRMGSRLSFLAAIVIGLLICLVAPSCGTIRTHGGIEHEYTYHFDDDCGHRHGHHKKPKKYKKHKKHKKHHRD